MLCSVMYVMLCFVMFCSVMLCYVMHGCMYVCLSACLSVCIIHSQEHNPLSVQAFHSISFQHESHLTWRASNITTCLFILVLLVFLKVCRALGQEHGFQHLSVGVGTHPDGTITALLVTLTHAACILSWGKIKSIRYIYICIYMFFSIYIHSNETKVTSNHYHIIYHIISYHIISYHDYVFKVGLSHVITAHI